MGNLDTTASIGRIDAAARAQSLGQTPDEVPPVQHGNIVVDAISWPTRILMCAVILGNLSLGAWLAQRSDFSQVRPQGSSLDSIQGGELAAHPTSSASDLQAVAHRHTGP